MKKEISLPVALISIIGFAAAAGVFVTGGTAALGDGDPSTAPAGAKAVPAQAAPAPVGAPAVRVEFAYKTPAFEEFVATSYKESANPKRPEFYAQMESAYERGRVRFKRLESYKTLDSLLGAIGQKYAAAQTPEEKALLEKQTGAYCHKFIKKSIRHFSLDRGFEFYQAVDRGERQCFLQSTLLAGMMQRAGMNAGVVMVTKSDRGEESNNGHAVTLVKLSNGHDLLVDASHKTPFIRQQGLMVADAATGTYRFVAPQYDTTGDQIVSYAPMTTAVTPIPVNTVRALSVPFMKSQFDYYRGERTPGGFFAKQKSPEGLADSEKFFTRAIQEDAENPLPVYALGRVELRLGKMDAARNQIEAAYKLYDRYGYVPQGAQEAIALVHAAPPAVMIR